MDQTDDRIEQDIKNIMQTRVAIGDKLEMLEQRVEEKMERSRTAVKDLVDHTAGVVEGMMDKTKQTIDPLYQFNQRPWLVLGGAVMLGYMVGLIETKMRSTGVYSYAPPGSDEPGVMPPGSRQARSMPDEGVYPYYPTGKQTGAGRPMAPQMSFVQDIAEGFMQEMDHVKAGLIEAGRAFLRDASSQIIPALLHTLGDRVKKNSASGQDSPHRPFNR
jgi:hypothetical protein